MSFHISDKRYLQPWLEALKPLHPEALWQRFTSLDRLPAPDFAVGASAVYSSNIEGNTLDLDSFMNSKIGRGKSRFKAKERKEIDKLIETYHFARANALNERNLLKAHGILSKPLLPRSQQGRYRNQVVFVYSQYGIEYAAVEPEFVKEKMREVFEDIAAIANEKNEVSTIFYHAALIHLVFVHIHPFQDGNGRTARLLEKWFLAEHLGMEAWQIPAEQFYKENRPEYYRNLKLGENYHFLNYDLCVPFLTMLPRALKNFME
jgi:Fic family protein